MKAEVKTYSLDNEIRLKIAQKYSPYMSSARKLVDEYNEKPSGKWFVELKGATDSEPYPWLSPYASVGDQNYEAEIKIFEKLAAKVLPIFEAAMETVISKDLTRRIRYSFVPTSGEIVKIRKELSTF